MSHTRLPSSSRHSDKSRLPAMYNPPMAKMVMKPRMIIHGIVKRNASGTKMVMMIAKNHEMMMVIQMTITTNGFNGPRKSNNPILHVHRH